MAAAAAVGDDTGGRGRITNASSVITTKQKIPRPRYVWRQPTVSTKCCTTGGQMAPPT
jgi:hypothetical protein